MSNDKLTIGGVIYPGFEMLDMFGPLEMFSMLGSELVQIVMVAQTKDPVPSAIAQNLTGGPRVSVVAWPRQKVLLPLPVRTLDFLNK